MFNFSRWCQVAFRSGRNNLHYHQQCVSARYILGSTCSHLGGCAGGSYFGLFSYTEQTSMVYFFMTSD